MKKQNIFFAVFLGLAFFIFACNHANEQENETKISRFGAVESHNAGQNCMNCHKKGGSGEYAFQVAGTVYDTSGTLIFPNVLVYLYTGPNGTGNLKYTIEGDAKGNFYTTENIDFGSTGLYPAIKGKNKTYYMSSPITGGACNGCHGVTTKKLYTE